MASVAHGFESDVPLATQTAAFEAFVEARRDAAVRVAYRLLGGDMAAAEDVAQTAFLRAYRALPGFRSEATLSTWFYRILIREVHRYRRWQRLRRLWSPDDAGEKEAVDPKPDRDPILRRRITAALERLTASQREAFILVHLEGLTIEEAARILGKAMGTMKSHLHRALESLRSDLTDVGRERSAP